jgi:glycosyltransferase involved in cell wall biosynthesis
MGTGGGVSAIVPAYRSAGTVREAIASVAGQTRPPDEVLVVDDASPDRTADVIEREIRSRPGYRLVRLDRNLGPAGARNRGIAEATGEWLAFLDADDAWLPHRLDVQLRLAREDPGVGLWCGRVTSLDGASPGSVQPGDAPLDTREIRIEHFVDQNEVATSTVLIRADVVRRVGGFDSRFRGPEDFDLWMRAAAVTRVVLVESVLCRYRSQWGSLSMDDRTFLPEVRRVLDKAFGPGGALSARTRLKRRALSNQFWNASWMAFHRGARATAVYYWCAAAVLGAGQGGAPRPWLALLGRYVTKATPRCADQARAPEAGA